MDIGFSFPYVLDPKTAESFGDMALAAKFSLAKDSAAITLTNTLGDKGYKISGVYTEYVLGIKHNLNLGYNATGIPTVPGFISYNYAFEIPFGIDTFVGELLGDEAALATWMFGIAKSIDKNSFFSFGYGNGFKENNERITMGFHLGL